MMRELSVAGTAGVAMWFRMFLPGDLTPLQTSALVNRDGCRVTVAVDHQNDISQTRSSKKNS